MGAVRRPVSRGRPRLHFLSAARCLLALHFVPHSATRRRRILSRMLISDELQKGVVQE